MSLLSIHNVCKSYGNVKALTDFSAELDCGVYALLGPNGSGKTTLLRTILSAEPPKKGRITWGRGVKRSYYDQGSDHLDQSLTVMDTMWKAYPRMYETPLRTALGAMGLTGEDAYRLVGSFPVENVHA